MKDEKGVYMDLDIDYLRKNNYSIYYFGLGFIQIKITPEARYHFWHPELLPTAPDEQIHDHRYTFTSKIIKGDIVHEVYSYTPNLKGQWEKIKVSCDPNDQINYDDPENKPTKCDVKLAGIYYLNEGSSYTFVEGEFHKTKTKSAITFLQRQPTVHKYAQVIKPINVGLVCPFEKKIKEEKLWEMVDSMLID